MDKLKEGGVRTLRFVERYTKTDMMYLASGGFWLTLGQFVSSLSSFFLALVFANFLPKEIYGTYKYILSVAGILSLATLSGMNISVISATVAGYKNTLIPAIKTEVRWGLLGGLGSLGLSIFYFTNENITLSFLFLIVAIFIPVMDSFNTYDSVLQGKRLFKISARYSMISQILATTALIASILLTKNIYIIVATYFLSWTLVRVICTMIVIKKMEIGQSGVEEEAFIKRGKHLSLIEISKTVAMQIDQIVLFHYLGAAKLAVYALAIAIPNQIKGVIKNVGGLAIPKIAEKSPEEMKKIILRKMLTLGMFITLIVALYILSAPFIFKILFPKYLDSIVFSQIFAISLIGTVSVLSTATLQLKASPKQLHKLNLSSSFIEIGSVVLLTYYFGLFGIVTARVLNRFVYLGISLFILRKI